MEKISFKTYFTRHIIDTDISTLPVFARLLTREYQVLIISLRNAIRNKYMLLSSSLTYWTLLAIVPFFALAFSILKGMGVQNRLEPFILSKVGINSKEVVAKIIQYVDNTNVQTLGTVGLLALIFTVLSLLSKIEKSFNLIWNVKKDRPLRRKFGDYLSIILVGPVFLLASISLTTTLHSSVIFQKIIGYGELPLSWLIGIVPYIITWCTFIFLYAFIPNTKVRLLPAVKAGILSGTLWQLAQWGYIHFQVGVVKYNAVYGAMAQLPVLLVWIYISWSILLLGVQISATFQKMDLIQGEFLTDKVSFASQELLAIGLMTVITGNFHYNKDAWTLSMFAEYFNVPVELLNRVFLPFVEAGLLEKGAGEDPVYIPKQLTENITLRQIVETLKCYGTDIKCQEENNIMLHIDQYLKKIDALFTDSFSEIKLNDLISLVKDLNKDAG